MLDDDALYRGVFKLAIDRSFFGIQEDRLDSELSSPAWLELEIDEVPVRVARGAVRIVSLVGTHRPLVAIEIRKKRPETPSGFKQIGRGCYLTYSGKATLYTLDGPHGSFSLAPNSEYEFIVWRKGQEAAPERHDDLLGRVYPIEGLEEYLIQFIEQWI
ncbi:hypothetical protein AB0953_26270 [Streptomyces sp. NPDC046866]|uniref:hypothetical protein n=1 Tax=Streptomyces sp. NPDC046866 TaxID=3154921 RepID=UPI0034523E26